MAKIALAIINNLFSKWSSPHTHIHTHLSSFASFHLPSCNLIKTKFDFRKIRKHEKNEWWCHINVKRVTVSMYPFPPSLALLHFHFILHSMSQSYFSFFFLLFFCFRQCDGKFLSLTYRHRRRLFDINEYNNTYWSVMFNIIFVMLTHKKIFPFPPQFVIHWVNNDKICER